jgi:TusA-related sulfurtransferase
MSRHLWTATAKRESGEIAKGMSVEIVVKNSSAKPNIREIAGALADKYGIKDYSSSGLSLSIFEIEEA